MSIIPGIRRVSNGGFGAATSGAIEGGNRDALVRGFYSTFPRRLWLLRPGTGTDQIVAYKTPTSDGLCLAFHVRLGTYWSRRLPRQRLIKCHSRRPGKPANSYHQVSHAVTYNGHDISCPSFFFLVFMFFFLLALAPTHTNGPSS